MNTSPDDIAKQVGAISDLPNFSEKSGIPYRTLFRIKQRARGYTMSKTTQIAIEAAIKRLKPKMEDASNGRR